MITVNWINWKYEGTFVCAWVPMLMPEYLDSVPEYSGVQGTLFLNTREYKYWLWRPKYSWVGYLYLRVILVISPIQYCQQYHMQIWNRYGMSITDQQQLSHHHLIYQGRIDIGHSSQHQYRLPGLTEQDWIELANLITSSNGPEPCQEMHVCQNARTMDKSCQPQHQPVPSQHWCLPMWNPEQDSSNKCRGWVPFTYMAARNVGYYSTWCTVQWLGCQEASSVPHASVYGHGAAQAIWSHAVTSHPSRERYKLAQHQDMVWQILVLSLLVLVCSGPVASRCMGKLIVRITPERNCCQTDTPCRHAHKVTNMPDMYDRQRQALKYTVPYFYVTTCYWWISSNLEYAS